MTLAQSLLPILLTAGVCSATLAFETPLEVVSLYKIAGEECGQATLDKKFETYAIKFAGLQEGVCSEQGYTVADGSKSIKVPTLGEIKVELFKKAASVPGPLAAFKIMLGTMVEVASPLETVSLYKIAQGECGQATLDKKFETFAKKFAGLQEGVCIEQGYTVADGSKSIKVPTLGEIKVELFKKAASVGTMVEVASPLETVSLYKIAQGECGQATLDKKFETYAIKFAGLQEGVCSEQGYTVADGSKSIKVPTLGEIKVELFKKAASVPGPLATFKIMLGTMVEVASPLETVSLYKIAQGECGQATLDKKFETYAKKFAGLQEGVCSEQGYTVADGSKSIKVSTLGEIKVELFKKVSGATPLMV